MLVLSRSLGQSICIGDAVEVTVVEVRGDIVYLRVEALPEASPPAPLFVSLRIPAASVPAFVPQDSPVSGFDR